MKRPLLILSILLILFLISGVTYAVVGLKWISPSVTLLLSQSQQGGCILLPDSALKPDIGVPLGTPLELTAEVDASFHYLPGFKLIPSLPEGMVIVGEPQVSTALGLFPPRWKNRLLLDLQTYRTGSLSGLGLSFHFSGYNCADTVLKLDSVLVLNITPLLDIEDELEFAERITPPKPDFTLWIWIGIAVIFIQLVIGIGLFFMRRAAIAARPRILPPWESALELIEKLKNRLQRKDISNERAMATLSDIVRSYLTRRFALPVSSMTTPEFFVLISRPGGPLSSSQREFLQAFMEAADLIKFAGMDADPALLEQAVAQAEILVEESRPQPDGGKK